MSSEKALMQEISTWKYLAEGLTQEHQQGVRADILRRVENLQEQLRPNGRVSSSELFQKHFGNESVSVDLKHPQMESFFEELNQECIKEGKVNQQEK